MGLGTTKNQVELIVPNPGKLYKIKADGTQKTLLMDGQVGSIYRFSIIGDYIYIQYIISLLIVICYSIIRIHKFEL